MNHASRSTARSNGGVSAAASANAIALDALLIAMAGLVARGGLLVIAIPELEKAFAIVSIFELVAVVCAHRRWPAVASNLFLSCCAGYVAYFWLYEWLLTWIGFDPTGAPQLPRLDVVVAGFGTDLMIVLAGWFGPGPVASAPQRSPRAPVDARPDTFLLMIYSVGACLIAATWAREYVSSYLAMAADDMVTRADIFEASSANSQWILKYLLSGFAICYGVVVVKRDPMLRRHRWLVWSLAASTIVLFSLQATVGNRREIVYVLVAWAAYWVLAGRRVRVAHLAVAVLIALGLANLGIWRTSFFQGDVAERSRSEVRFAGVGELMLPRATLNVLHEGSFTPRSSMPPPLRTPFFFIPKSLMANKPGSVGVEFSEYMAAGQARMGYAFTPASEFYLFFGLLGLAALPVVLFMYVWLVRRVVCGASPEITAAAVPLMIWLNRGEFSAHPVELVLVLAPSLVLWRICSRRSVRAFDPR